ncbi:zeta toxin family protein [Legionella brunensis]|uniref:Toxin PezT n=1 Tax=Legionella brunensis TaxID=29422 RepID=A0A0W0SVA7_9GAMM|nr:zeta toxin family protein [Legionella brunensis]KTC86869.1 Toxin PezT [Legionella brunensis]
MSKMLKSVIILHLLFWGGFSNAQQLICPPVNEQGQLRIDSQAINILEQCIKQAPSTKSLFFNNKTQQYAAARQQLHNKIIDEIVKTSPCQVQKPMAIFTGGFPGSGKSTYLQEKLPWVNSQNFIMIDPDAIRAKLPEYKGWNVESTQAEVRDIVLAILNRLGSPCRYNLVYDSSMTATDFYEEFFAKLKSMHYQIYIVYVKTPLSVAVARAKERYLETGRYVSQAYLKHIEKNGRATFNTIKNDATGYIVVDGENFQTLEQVGKKFPTHPNVQN